MERDNLRGLPRKIVAVDFDAASFRIVRAERAAGRMRVREMTSVGLPDGTDVTNAAATGRALGAALKDLGLSGSRVLLNVSRGQAVLKPITLPRGVDENEIASMVQFQVGRELPFRPDEAVIDFTRAARYHAELSQEATVEGQQVLVAAVTVPVVDYFRTVAQAAGVKLTRLGLRSFANARCVQHCLGAEPSGRVALVHVTADETEIDVVEAGSLTFSRSAFVKAPREDDPPSRSDAAVSTITMEVIRSLQSYQASEQDGGIERLYVAGATGIEGRVLQRLSQRLRIDCLMLNPGKALGLQEDPGASAFVSALGLALTPASEEGPAMDFLHPRKPVRVRDARKTRMAVAVAAGAVLVAALTAWAVHGAVERGMKINKLTAQYNKLKDEKREVETLRKRLGIVQAWEEGDAAWLDHWAQLSAVLPGPEDVYVRSIGANPDGSMSLVVRAKSAAVITDIGRRLSAAGYTARPGQISTSNDRLGYVYGTTVRVEVAPSETVPLGRLRSASRPADDASADPEQTRPRTGGGPARPRTGGGRPVAEQDEEFRKVGFDAFAPGAANSLNGAPVQIEAVFGDKQEVYLLPGIDKEQWACVELLERVEGHPPRAILAYVDRKGRAYRSVAWMFSNKDRFRQSGIRFRGKATHVPQGWQPSGGATACPVAFVIDSARTR